MHKDLLLEAFVKIEHELNKEGLKSPSVNKCAKELSLIISETFPYGDRSLRDFYNAAKSSAAEDIDIPQPQVLNTLAKYLGYTDYKNYLLQKNYNEVQIPEMLNTSISDESLSSSRNRELDKDNIGGKVSSFSEKNPKKNKSLSKIIVGGILIGLAALALFLFLREPDWMIWKKDHYEIVPFKAEKLESSELKIYNENHYENQKMILPTCETQFFNPDGSVRVWYGKNRKKELEYFTALGKHPETGKSLRPITKYMIDKYICAR